VIKWTNWFTGKWQNTKTHIKSKTYVESKTFERCYLEKYFFWRKMSSVLKKFTLNLRNTSEYLTSLGVWFSKNRPKYFSAVAKSFLRVKWCFKLYQKFAGTLRNIFLIDNVLRKCLEKNSMSQKQSFVGFEKKAIFDIRFWILALSDNAFLKIDKNISQLSWNHFYASIDVLSYTKS